jgi:predicted dehydrogenase
VDGTKGTAVAGLRNCKIQPYNATPRPVWNPDIDQPIDFFDDWMTVPTNQVFDNGFKVQWEMFLKHIVLDTPWQYDLREGAKGVQLAEAGLTSWAERRWVTLDNLPK